MKPFVTYGLWMIMICQCRFMDFEETGTQKSTIWNVLGEQIKLLDWKKIWAEWFGLFHLIFRELRGRQWNRIIESQR